ncbi:MAG: response regulator [Gammaproteobacteria bacterium]|nr:response regulator [Gammaproteobacteria bacterium]
MVDQFPPPYQREIERQALTFVRDYALMAGASLVMALSLVALAIYQSFPSPLVIQWIILIWIVQGLSLMYRRRMPISDLPHRKKILAGILVNMFDGFVIASCLLFFPVIDDIMRMLLVTLLLIACTGAIATTVGYLPFYLAFASPVVLSVVVSTALSPILSNGSFVLLLVSALSLMAGYPLIKMSTAIFSHFRDAFEANLRYLQANAELQEAVREARLANASKTRFLAAASHDLRQPINTLSLFVANLSLKNVDEDQKEIISHMNTAINSVDAQLESLLDISKLDAGVVEVNAGETEVVSLVRDLVGSFERQSTEARRINFSSNFDSITVNTDPALFQRVLGNLIGNAVKYTDHGWINVRLDMAGSNAQITIKDTGIGIDAAELPKVFEEFYQIGNPERSEANGLGLGLSIVGRLVKLLDMQIDLESELGVGTRVTLEITAIKSSRAVKEATPERERSVQNETKRVLALDNESSILLALRGVVETMGHSIETFTDSNSALAAFAERDFDLALIDFRLPGGLNGQEIIRKMRSMNNAARFYLVTGDSNIQSDTSDCEIIYKPLTGKKLNLIFN